MDVTIAMLMFLAFSSFLAHFTNGGSGGTDG